MTKLFKPCHCERSVAIAKLSNRTDDAITTQTSFARNDKRTAFTIAEVLITLAIIGVVAAMTIPTLVANYQQKSWDTAASVFNRRLGEALKVMNVNSNLAGFDSTQAFVDELGKHIKITRTCASDKLTDCFVETIYTGADPIDTTKLKQAKNLNSTTDYGTETIGVQFADGVSALIAYNKSIVNDPYSNEVVKVTGTDQKTVGLSTQALSILYDVSGAKTPNLYTNTKDIRGINIALNVKNFTSQLKDGTYLYIIGTSYNSVDCTNPDSVGYEYCNTNDKNYSTNYWVGAKYTCAQNDMRLPTIDDLHDLYARKGEEGVPTEGAFLSSTEMATYNSRYLSLAGGYENNWDKRNQMNVMCIGN